MTEAVPPTFNKGEAVRVRLHGKRRWARGTVELVSTNGKSIGIWLRDEVDASDGLVFGALPLLWADANWHGILSSSDVYQLEHVDSVNCFICPRCDRTSYHPTDIIERYCGHCHQTFEPARMGA